ncbi:MAG: hypothetical protein ACREC9_06130 [Methylocella sp.]
MDGTSTAGSLNLTIVDSVASNNPNIGVVVAGAATAVMVRNSVASNNGTGLDVGFNAILRVAHSVVTGNGLGLFKGSSGTLDSYGDNDIDGNLTDNTGALTPLALH